MKKLALTFLLMAFAAPAFAQGTLVRFIDFDELIITSNVKKPHALYVEGAERAKFDRLLKLKKSFLPKLQATAKDAQLR